MIEHGCSTTLFATGGRPFTILPHKANPSKVFQRLKLLEVFFMFLKNLWRYNVAYLCPSEAVKLLFLRVW
jgi:hypothetical protein